MKVDAFNLEVRNANKICCFIPPYRSLTQTKDEVEIFKSNLDLNLDSLSRCNPFLTIPFGDFNSVSKQ